MDVGLGLWAMRATATRPASHPRLYAELAQDARLAEELGFHSVWIAEHHFWYDGWCPAPLIAGAAVLGATSRLRVGTGIAQLPLYDPPAAAVARIAAMHDLSGGRLELGVGLGYRDAEFDGFGLVRRERGRRMEAALQALAQWRDEAGSAPRVWVGGMAPAAITRATRHGHGLLLPQTLTIEQVRATVALVRETAGEAGAPLPPLATLRYAWATDGSEAEAAAARSAIDSTMREYTGSWFRLKGRPGFESPEALQRQVSRATDTALIGTPAEISVGLAELEDAGIDLAVLHLTCDGVRVDHAENMRTISEHVLPASAVSAP